MTRRSTHQTIAENVSTAIISADVSPALVAEAAHLPVGELNDRLEGRTPFSVLELALVGGFLRLRASTFLEGVPA